MPLPIISVAQMRDWEERTWEGGVSQKSVMANAGLAVAQSALAMTPEGGGVLEIHALLPQICLGVCRF
jgi:NAD(P)H-hydrate repair Nnr-like enzyme with NAD(P)H-hydrate epimerase domain